MLLKNNEFNLIKMKKMLSWMLFTAVLFYLLTPGVLVSLPPGGTTSTKALTHAVVFALAYCFLGGMLKKSLH
jgi:hypothetical protein